MWSNEADEGEVMGIEVGLPQAEMPFCLPFFYSHSRLLLVIAQNLVARFWNHPIKSAPACLSELLRALSFFFVLTRPFVHLALCSKHLPPTPWSPDMSCPRLHSRLCSLALSFIRHCVLPTFGTPTMSTRCAMHWIQTHWRCAVLVRFLLSSITTLRCTVMCQNSTTLQAFGIFFRDENSFLLGEKIGIMLFLEGAIRLNFSREWIHNRVFLFLWF